MKKQFISMWCRYDTLGASSRLRFLQFIPELEKAGFEVASHHFFDNEYLKQLYSGNGKSKLAAIRSLFKRFRELSDLPPGTPMLIEYELLPFMPFFIEKQKLKNHPYILNFDDAVDLRYENIPVLRSKYPQLIAGAAGVITANDELLNRFSKYNCNIFKLPTVPPPPPASAAADKPSEILRIGWIGTPVTYKFLLQHTHILQQMYAAHPFELLAIARADLPPVPGIPTVNINWSAENEHALLQSCHIGIMPLDDSPFAKGKSAYKLIQYLRAGIPAIASAVGENNRVIIHGETGFCASTADEWISALLKLADPDVRAAMQCAVSTEAEKYSFEKNTAALINFLNSTLGDAAR